MFPHTGQEESRNLSENTRWGLVRRFENGIVSVNHNKFLGYTKDKNGELVRRIFRLYLEGLSVIQIIKILESTDKKAPYGDVRTA